MSLQYLHVPEHFLALNYARFKKKNVPVFLALVCGYQHTLITAMIYKCITLKMAITRKTRCGA